MANEQKSRSAANGDGTARQSPNDKCSDADLNASPAEATEEDRDCAKQQAEAQAKQSGQAPPIDFSTFIYSLSTQALVMMGEAQLPGMQAIKPDLPAAKQTIDIIEMLEEKTKGNLKESEAKLISNFLYDLRIRYVKNSRKKS